MNNLDADIAAYEAELAAKAKAEIAKEDAAWASLPQAEKDRISEERQARFVDVPDTDEDPEDDDDEE